MTIIERGESYYQPVMPDIVQDLEAKGTETHEYVNIIPVIYVCDSEICAFWPKKGNLWILFIHVRGSPWGVAILL